MTDMDLFDAKLITSAKTMESDNGKSNEEQHWTLLDVQHSFVRVKGPFLVPDTLLNQV